MRILLSDGSGLTARQCATRLVAAGHVVEALAPDPLCLCRFTRHVARVHRVPAYGSDPLGWLSTAIDIYRSGRFDVLFPTQEQVAVLSWAKDRLDTAGVATVIPPFAALAAVQDKIAASATLRRLGIAQPETGEDIEGWVHFPAFVKDPIGTASRGVRRVRTPSELQEAAVGRTVLIQAAIDGPLLMCQSVFDHGSLVAFHANERTGEGANGGASHKRSISSPEVRNAFEILGSDLEWHGALSADVILSQVAPVFIDLNPRLVEPQNAYLSGVDLVGAMLCLAADDHPAVQTDGRSGVATHQILLAILGAAQHGGGRRGVMAELVHAVSKSHDYASSSEELTPIREDLLSVVPVAMAAIATLVAPRSWSLFASGSISNYALSEDGWRLILHTDPSSECLERESKNGSARRSLTKAGNRRPASRTAGLMAVQRGLESARPVGERLFEDRLASAFLNPAWRATLTAARIGPIRRVIEATYDYVGGPGPRPSAIVRTRLIDDHLEELAQKVGQVVILGAGYDTRPYRLPHLRGYEVFEVDHPQTQAAKRTVLRRAGIDTSLVHFVPLDFETDDLGSALAQAGLSLHTPTLYLWEGVSQYLSHKAVDATLSTIHEWAGDGGWLIFTYVDKKVIDGKCAEFPEARKWLRGVNKRGEPWIFGLSPCEADQYLSSRGFRLVEDLSTADAGTRYFRPLGRSDRGSELYRIATAVVHPPVEAG